MARRDPVLSSWRGHGADQQMDVRMVKHGAGPGVEDGQHRQSFRPHSWAPWPTRNRRPVRSAAEQRKPRRCRTGLGPQLCGGRLAMLAILHTWTRAMLYHPHVHLLVKRRWPRQGPTTLDRGAPSRLPGSRFALSKIFRGKFRAGLRKPRLFGQIPSTVWQQNWVVHCQHAGQGQKSWTIWRATCFALPSPTAGSNTSARAG